MTLPPPTLDDLTWADMMAAIRRRIPAESDGTWTLHAPVDPGVTLLELFAYLLEQRLYWLDQVPDALVVAILRLLRLEPPRPARPAATVLHLDARQEDTAVPVVPAGTALTRDPTGRIAFTLDDDVAVLPLAEGGEITVWTDRDRTADLRARRGVALLASGGAPAEARFTLPLTGTHPAAGPINLLVELDAPAACVPSWLPGAVADVPPPAELTWSWFRPGTDISGTFRRSRTARPGSGAPVSCGCTLRPTGPPRTPGFWCRPRPPPTRPRPAFSSSPSTCPPHITAPPAPWTAPTSMSRPAPGSGCPDSISSCRTPPTASWRPPCAWRARSGCRCRTSPSAHSADRVFVLDRAEGALVFGDGLTGRIPRPDPDVQVAYAIGGGRDGNGGMTGNWLPAQDLLGAVSAANLVRAEGGADPETIAEARRRAAASLGEVTRAVTADDFVTLARTTPGVAVARAYPALGEHPGFPCATVPGAVTVHIVPAAPRDDLGREDFVAAPLPDPGMLCAVATRLEQARLLTSEVFVRPPRYRDVALRVDLSGDPADRTRVATAVTDALRRFLDPLVGGDDEDGWPFGQPLRPSALLRAAQRALGDLADIAAIGVGLDGADPAEACDEVPLAAGELPVLRTVRTRIVPAVEPGEGLV
jgi:hypothetical protein